MPETEGEKRLKRATKLLGTDHFDKKKDEPQPSKTADPSPPPVVTPPPPAPETPPTVGIPPVPSIPAPLGSAVQSPPPAKEADPPAPSGQSPSPTTPPASPSVGPAPRLKATKIVDNQYHVEHVYETPVATPDAPKSVTPPAPVAQPTLPWKGHNGDQHPKVSWGVRVTLETYDFIKAHDGIRLRLLDKRMFKEKLLDWLDELKRQVEVELQGTPPPTPPTSDGDKSGSKTDDEKTVTL